MLYFSNFQGVVRDHTYDLKTLLTWDPNGWWSEVGSVIQATEMTEFEDGLNRGNQSEVGNIL